MSQDNFLNNLLRAVGEDEGANSDDNFARAFQSLAELGPGPDLDEIINAARPGKEYTYAMMKIGFEDCDDDDALVVLALIEAFELFTNFTYEHPSATMAPVISGCVSSHTESSNKIIKRITEISLVRAHALGREIPKIEDFMPKSKIDANSGVADRTKSSTPVFIPPTGLAG